MLKIGITLNIFRMKIANFISGGKYQLYEGLYAEHSAMRTITHSIAMEALAKNDLKTARETYETEFRDAELAHFNRVTKILDGVTNHN